MLDADGNDPDADRDPAAGAATAGPATENPAGTDRPRRPFPSALTIMAAVGIGIWVLTFFLPSGSYRLDESGNPIPGSYTQVPSPLTTGQRIVDLLASPFNGVYGILNTATGQVGPFNSGPLFGSAQVFFFILAIGAFMTVVKRTGSLDLAISHLAVRFQAKGFVLIIALCLVFGFLGSMKSWADETIGFYALMIPLLLGLRYDRLVVVAVVTVAPFAGIVGSVFNPFRIGIGSEAAGIEMVDGMWVRIAIFVTIMAVTIAYILRYAGRVRADPSTSLVGITDDDRAIVTAAQDSELEHLTSRHKVVVGLVLLTFALMVFSLVPWGALLGTSEIDPSTNKEIAPSFWWELNWWMPELSAMFVVMAVVIGLVGRLGEKNLSGAIVQGCMDFAGPAILVVLARGIAVILNNTQTLDTILNSMESLVTGTSKAVFVIALSTITVPLSALIGSGSAGTALVMPVLAPLADFADVDRALVVTIYSSVGGWIAMILPINAILMAGLVLAKVPYGKYVRFMLPLLAVQIVLLLAIFLISLAF